MLAILGKILLGALCFGGWLYMTAEYVRAAKRGKFAVWRRRANGATWPPVRAESPAKFWTYWALMGFPYLIGTFLFAAVLIGLILQ